MTPCFCGATIDTGKDVGILLWLLHLYATFHFIMFYAYGKLLLIQFLSPQTMVIVACCFGYIFILRRK
jgi:hypothetical protein